MEYYDLHVQIYTILLADVFENSLNMFPETHELETDRFLNATGLSWQAVFKKSNKSKIRSFN